MGVSIRTPAAALLVALLAWPAPVRPAPGEGFDPASPQPAHWAFRPPVRPRLPGVRRAGWVRNPVDAFILARLEAAGLAPSPPADRLTLLRRVTFDLSGLPPTPREQSDFLSDRRADAYERVVDRLLASPRYGERWGRHWLDLVRYADTNGYEHDELRPDAWRYRDYVIRALNADKPFDRFMSEQIAGDELPGATDDARIATGFALLGPDMTDAVDAATRRQVTLNDATDTVGLTFMALTVACARCHDHKYEPIPQQDYYRLQAYFCSADARFDLPLGSAAERAAYAAAMDRHRALLGPTQRQIDAVEAPYREQIDSEKRARLAEDVRTALATPEALRTVEQQILAANATKQISATPVEVEKRLSAPDRERYQQLRNQLLKMDERRPASPPVAMGLQDSGGPARAFVLERGDFDSRGPLVSAGIPVVLQSGAAGTVGPSRLELAAWLTRPDHPLTARVIVNRVWQGHFGSGIVPTPSDFGERGEPPSHPELLDWLATTFVSGSWAPGSSGPSAARPWSLKALHRLIVNSNTYRQSAASSTVARQRDPSNRLLSHANRRRLEGEAVRDAALLAAGSLNPKMGGPGVLPPLGTGELPVKAWPVSPDPAEHRRRSVYILVRRNLRFPLLEALDSPDANLSCPRREVTTTAPQALALFNGSEIRTCARLLAERLEREGGTDDSQRVDLAYRLALGRGPTPAERRLALGFLPRHAALVQGREKNPREAALAAFCLALLNTNEFVYVD